MEAKIKIYKKHKCRLVSFENKVLRRVYGSLNDGGVWRIKKQQRTAHDVHESKHNSNN